MVDEEVVNINQKELESIELHLSSALARETLNWRPFFSQEEAVITTIQWWKSHLSLSHKPSALITSEIERFLKSKA
jgi:nucleoside-diphosphate-sugar epimerase